MNQIIGLVLFLGGIALVVCGTFDFSMDTLVNTQGGLLAVKILVLAFALPAAIVGGIVLRFERKGP